jgi:hypothetical protein
MGGRHLPPPLDRPAWLAYRADVRCPLGRAGPSRALEVPVTFVRPLAAGALLTLGCSGRPSSPDASAGGAIASESPERGIGAAPAADPTPSPSPAVPPDRRPTWEQSAPERYDADGQLRPLPPEPRTNPPTPALVIGSDGQCYRTSYDPRRGPAHDWRRVESGRRATDVARPRGLRGVVRGRGAGPWLGAGVGRNPTRRPRAPRAPRGLPGYARANSHTSTFSLVRRSRPSSVSVPWTRRRSTCTSRRRPRASSAWMG